VGLPGEVITDETEVSDAIHSAAHPGRQAHADVEDATDATEEVAP